HARRRARRAPGQGAGRGHPARLALRPGTGRAALGALRPGCVPRGLRYHDRTMKLTIDGRSVELDDGATVLDGVNRLGLALPQLCKDPDRPALGACRTCLVHVDGMRGVPAACHLPARDGMVVSTDHPEAQRVRTVILD